MHSIVIVVEGRPITIETTLECDAIVVGALIGTKKNGAEPPPVNVYKGLRRLHAWEAGEKIELQDRSQPRNNNV